MKLAAKRAEEGAVMQSAGRQRAERHDAHPQGQAAAMAGFSMVELMIVIAIVAILLAIGLPSFQGSLRSNRVATTSNELMASVALARSEAVRSARGSGLCASADGATCVGSWNDGWIVWIDGDGNGLPGGATDSVVRVNQGNDNLALAATVTAGGGDADIVLFDGRGRERNNTARRVTVESTPCPATVELVRHLDINAAGQVRISRDTCP
jgi:type IV fimbrial biogenesis protein FimT